QEGRQAFIICPLIEESETLAVKSATAEYERLSRDVFPHLRLGLLHGSMKAADKDAVMRKFRDGELDILVATSVIEVGIDIPNATVMVIEDADRFGLSQLHQLRVRVGGGRARGTRLRAKGGRGVRPTSTPVTDAVRSEGGRVGTAQRERRSRCAG